MLKVIELSVYKKYIMKIGLIAYLGGVLFGIGLCGILYKTYHKPPENESHVKSCKFPINEGEMTVITILNNKYICWRWI